MLRLQVTGNLGKDCEVNTFNEKKVINFSVAHTEKWTDNKGEKQQKVTWVECSYWAEKTGISEYLKKGTQVLVEGKPEARAFKNKEGEPAASLRIRVSNIELLGGSKGEKSNEGSVGSQSSSPASNGSNGSSPAADDSLEGLPF